MYLCQPCHEEANCTAIRCLITTSFGSCERCKKSGPCIDCRDYAFRQDVETVDNTLPSFPVDDVTLAAIEHALQGSYTLDEHGNHVLVGAEFTLDRVLDLAAGIDRSQDADHLHPVSEGVVVDDRVHFTPNDVIKALIIEVRRLRALGQDITGRFTEQGHVGRECLRTGWQYRETVEEWRAGFRGQ